MVRNLVLFFATFTTFIGILITFHSLVLDDGPWIWNLSKAVASVFVVGVGFLTWRFSKSVEADIVAETTLLFAVMTLMVVGGAGLAWTLHISIVSGEFEIWLVAVILIVIAQGCATTVYLVRRAGMRDGRLNHHPR